MLNINKTQYTLVKIPIKEIVNQEYNVELTQDQEIDNEYLIKQGNSPLFDQIEMLRGHSCERIDEIILVVAKKNKNQEENLRYILDNGFSYNGIHYKRFGKSASQGKDGITAFVSDAIFDELYMITQMDIEIDECVISKYEAQRCLVFSSCILFRSVCYKWSGLPCIRARLSIFSTYCGWFDRYSNTYTRLRGGKLKCQIQE